jgi:hypothetical protein
MQEAIGVSDSYLESIDGAWKVAVATSKETTGGQVKHSKAKE